ncbi:hypothetical protein [Viridibacterium curvum]|uniref:Polysaccharide biosynthesis protein n=1 Tax=Viridibacterium curvum TaxID=1101404 RepID=A0ABP9QLT5_9RHOO
MLLIVVGRLLQFLIMFVSVKLMTTLLPPQQAGVAALVTTTTSFFALFLVNPVGMFINRRLHAWVEAGVMRRRFHLYCLYLAGVALCSGLFVWGMAEVGWFDTGLGGWTMALLVSTSLLFNTINQTLIPSLNMIGRVRGFMALTLLTLFGGLLASWSLGHFSGLHSALSWLAGAIMAQAVFGLVAYRIFFKRPESAVPDMPRAVQLSSLFDFCWPVALAVAFNWVHMQGYRFLLAEEGGLAELGLFAAGYGIAAAVLAAVEMILGTRLQPLFYRRANSADVAERGQAWAAYARALVPAATLAAAAVMAAAPDLTPVMLGPEYVGASRYVALGACAEWARMMIGIFSLNSHLHMNTRRLILPNLGGAVVSTLLIVCLLPAQGLMVAPLAVMAGGLLIIVALYCFARAGADRMRLDVAGLVSGLVLSVLLVAGMSVLRSTLAAAGSQLPHLLGLLCVAVVWSAVCALLFRDRIVRPLLREA